MKQSERITQFVEAIWQWFKEYKRTLPWRDLQIKDDTQRAYQVLVSEIMLQQTQVSRVVIKYQEFLTCFPTVADLAKASNKDVILVWQGMGYNSRALRLRDAAKYIVERKGFPNTYDDLIQIPGIGPYTAAAILNFAFNIPMPCIDTNIRRILHRTFVGPEHVDGTWDQGDRKLLELAEKVLKEVEDQGISAADWHAALMDFGSLIQTKTNPKWEVCPLTEQGIMKTTPVMFQKSVETPQCGVSKQKPKEPGRYLNKKFVPNRIFRGRIVEYLRKNNQGTPEEIGKDICEDWSQGDHLDWLQVLLEKLVDDRILSWDGNEVCLKE